MSTLAQPSDTPQAQRVEAAKRQWPTATAPGFLDLDGSSVTDAESLGKVEWWLDFRHFYHREMKPHLDRWEARAGHSHYANARARSIAIEPHDRLSTCGKRFRTVRCACKVLKLPVGCDFKLCSDCQRRKLRRVRRRLIRATKMHSSARGPRWRWLLLTLTVRHSGDLHVDRERIVRGWRRLRQWLHRRFGKFPFALAWECTNGADGLGNIHAHVAAQWPWIDWNEVREAWLRAMEGHSSQIDIVAARKGGGGAAAYLAKYATKGVSPYALHPQIAAKFLAASYGKRTVYASHGFWRPLLPECRCCGSPWESAEIPAPLVVASVMAVFTSTCRRRGVPLAVGPPQSRLRFAPDASAKAS